MKADILDTDTGYLLVIYYWKDLLKIVNSSKTLPIITSSRLRIIRPVFNPATHLSMARSAVSIYVYSPECSYLKRPKLSSPHVLWEKTMIMFCNRVVHPHTISLSKHSIYIKQLLARHHVYVTSRMSLLCKYFAHNTSLNPLWLICVIGAVIRVQ